MGDGPSNQEVPTAVTYRSLSARLDGIDQKIVDAVVLPVYVMPDEPDPPATGAILYVRDDGGTVEIWAIWADGTKRLVTEKNPV